MDIRKETDCWHTRSFCWEMFFVLPWTSWRVPLGHWHLLTSWQTTWKTSKVSDYPMSSEKYIRHHKRCMWVHKSNNLSLWFGRSEYMPAYLLNLCKCGPGFLPLCNCNIEIWFGSSIPSGAQQMWDLVWTPKTKLRWSWWWHHPAFSGANPTECYLKRSRGRYGFTCSRVSTEICPKDWESRSIFVYDSLFVPFGWAFEQPIIGYFGHPLLFMVPDVEETREDFWHQFVGMARRVFLKGGRQVICAWWIYSMQLNHQNHSSSTHHIAIWNHLEPLWTHLWIHQASLICCPIV